MMGQELRHAAENRRMGPTGNMVLKDGTIEGETTGSGDGDATNDGISDGDREYCWLYGIVR